MKRSITVKVAFNGPRANVPSTQSVIDRFKSAVPGQGAYGANAAVTLVKTTEDNGRPGQPTPTAAKALVAELERVNSGRADATSQAQIKALVARIKTALG